ncbi:MAG: HAD-IA family hydrolase [Verrucomicrobium sp.]|nr:HAD-IA family hydrolase [Verrucomicrobium sp.]
MTKPSVYFFDAAGTLLHPARPVGETYAAIARAHGAELDPARLQEGFRAAFRKLGPRAAGTVPENGDDRAWWRQVVRLSVEGQPAPAAFEPWFEELYTHFSQPEVWRLFPDVAPTLEALQGSGARLAVLSNWDARLRPVLEGLGLGRFFERLFISAEMGCAKPDPLIFRKALAAMDCAPEEAAMVGDEAAHDDVPARAQGLRAYLLDRPRRGLEGLLESLD